jgi:RNA polymerase sigma factor (TIGR02999 family)
MVAGNLRYWQPMTDPGTITRVLNSQRDPSDPATAAVERQLYREMRRIALGQMRGKGGKARARSGQIGMGQDQMDQLDLGATVLVHEAWLKLERTGQWDSRAHFFGSAARAMRQVLAREGKRQKGRAKGERAAGLRREEWSASTAALLERAVDVDQALRDLEREDAQLGQIAVMRLYGDMPAMLIAEELGVSRRTVERRWKYAAVRLRSLVERRRTRH